MVMRPLLQLLVDGFIKSGGNSDQFLKADGSVDGSTYATTTQLSQESFNRQSAVVN